MSKQETGSNSIFSVPAEISSNTHCDLEKYKKLYDQSLREPEVFWKEQSKRLDWFRSPEIIKNASFSGDHSVRWYEDGELNASFNCLDRHLEKTE